MTEKWKSISILVVAQIFALSVWFSATAVVPELQKNFDLPSFQISLFTTAVQVGFVFGTLLSAILGLADRLNPKLFFALSAIVAALANAFILALDITSYWVIALRFITGVCMAGVYPVGMKLAVSWAKNDLGLLVGLLVGALTLGSAFPHLFNSLGGIDWQLTIGFSTLFAFASAFLIGFMSIGPNMRPSPKFDKSAAWTAFRDPALRLANFGYLGHMWELYAMWAWLSVFISASFQINPGPDWDIWAGVATFSTIGICGAIGCIAGGWLADQYGRTRLTVWAMSISGFCALTVGFFFGGNPVLLIIVCFVWGIAVIADSAQFSSAIAELAPPERIGTMLTIQTSAGFLLTLITIQTIPYMVDLLTWKLAFSFLAVGPVVGVVSMSLLRRHPDSVKLASGRK